MERSTSPERELCRSLKEAAVHCLLNRVHYLDWVVASGWVSLRGLLASYARWNTRQKPEMSINYEFHFAFRASSNRVVRLLTGGTLIGRRMCHALLQRTRSAGFPGCRRIVRLVCRLRGSFHKISLTAIASSVTNTTSTDHEESLADGRLFSLVDIVMLSPCRRPSSLSFFLLLGAKTESILGFELLIPQTCTCCG